MLATMFMKGKNLLHPSSCRKRYEKCALQRLISIRNMSFSWTYHVFWLQYSNEAIKNLARISFHLFRCFTLCHFSGVRCDPHICTLQMKRTESLVVFIYICSILFSRSPLALLTCGLFYQFDAILCGFFFKGFRFFSVLLYTCKYYTVD